ncbi:Tyrosinase [Fusarium agapanthi]|uniref:Tyrosinase n=1 Tax=Fusarium agapanthi TaxID=1803897 RepID=A0A9P5BJI9_9HYPO|nr:Tyrosinase [Fusarium agapanthi]
MRFLSLTFPALCAAAAVSECENPTKRVEWRELDDAARQQYTDAVVCLTAKLSRLGLNTTLYDDFPPVHTVASFLPWHRYFVHVYEGALRRCGYKGVMPYWDWYLDADDTPKPTIWDPKTGFGVSRRRTFKDLFPAYLTTEYDPHCLARDWNDGSENVGNMLSENYNNEAVAKVQVFKDYDNYRQKLEAGPHGAIGGDMVPNTSPNGKSCVLVPCILEAIANEDPKTRTMEFVGYKTQDQFDGTKPPSASLDDILLMNGLADDLRVEDLMSTQSSLLCYSYQVQS